VANKKANGVAPSKPAKAWVRSRRCVSEHHVPHGRMDPLRTLRCPPLPPAFPRPARTLQGHLRRPPPLPARGLPDQPPDRLRAPPGLPVSLSETALPFLPRIGTYLTGQVHAFQALPKPLSGAHGVQMNIPLGHFDALVPQDRLERLDVFPTLT
jgi:hypothetical protein